MGLEHTPVIQQISALLFTCWVLFITLSSPVSVHHSWSSHQETEPWTAVPESTAFVLLFFFPAWIFPPVVLGFFLEKRTPWRVGEGTDEAVVQSAARQTPCVWRFVQLSACTDCSTVEVEQRLKTRTPVELLPAWTQCRKSGLPGAEVPVVPC